MATHKEKIMIKNTKHKEIKGNNVKEIAKKIIEESKKTKILGVDIELEVNGKNEKK